MKKKLLQNAFCLIWALHMAPAVNSHPVPTPEGGRQEASAVIAKVDPRVELMSVIARLAGFQEYVRNEFKLYADDVDKHFGKHKQHPAVQFAVKMRQSNGVSFDAVMFMAVHLNPPPALTPRVTFTDTAPERRWGKEPAEEFVKLLQQFYKDADCEGFFKAHADLYRVAEERFQQSLNKVDFAWYKRFYGEAPEGAFNPVVEAYYSDLAKRIEFKASRFDELRPRVTSIVQFNNGAQDVDPGVTQLTINFDKPLNSKGYSFSHGQSGMEHYPIEKALGFNETGTAITLQLRMKADWEYEFVLTDLGFRSKDGHSLKPYTVKFKTRKQ